MQIASREIARLNREWERLTAPFYPERYLH